MDKILDCRDVTFDIMKGVGILLMLVGHYWPESQYAHQFIYSFHMPLFFLVAGYFSKPPMACVWEVIKKNAKRLLLPFVMTQLLLVIWGVAQTLAKHDLSYVIKPGLSLLWGGADVLDSQWGMVYVGPIWFLPALFFGKTVFELIISKLQNWSSFIVCVVISVSTIVLHKYLNSPWCILQGLSCLTFMSIGFLYKNKVFPRWLSWIALASWPLAVFLSSMEVVDCFYKMYPLDVIGACGGTLFIWWISGRIKKINFLSKPFAWVGVLSLVVLCFHNFEWFSAIPYSIVCHLPFDILGNWMVLFRFVFTILLVFVVVKTPLVREMYGVRKKIID